MEKMRNGLDKYKSPITFLTVFSAIFIRYIYYGFNYYYQLDDYIQYHNFATSPDYGELIIKQGLLATRPLAGICDIYVWSKLYGVMIFGVLIISLMYAASALLFLAVFRRLFGTGMFFAAVYTLLPLGFEGTYWMSASTRIVTGLFFASLAIFLFQKLCDTGERRYIPLWMFIQLVSYCFYEQVLVYSFTLTILIMLINICCKLKSHSKVRYSLWGIWSLVNAVIYFAFTGMFAGQGTITARMEIILPTSDYYYKVFFPEIARQIGAAFIRGGLLTLIKGFIRGLKFIITDFAWLYILAVCCIIVLYFILSKKSDNRKNKTSIITALIAGFLLTLAPVTPFLILGNPWFSLRGTVCSFAGIALIADAVLRIICGNKAAALKAVTASLVFVCCIASVSEIHDYKATYEYDRMVSNTILDKVGGKTDLGRVGILNLNASYLDDQNYFYHEHIHGITENDWALRGAIISIADGTLYSDVVPLATDGFSYYTGWNREMKNIGGFDTLYFWNSEREELLPLTVKKEGDSAYMLYYADGTKCAYIWEEDGCGYVELY